MEMLSDEKHSLLKDLHYDSNSTRYQFEFKTELDDPSLTKTLFCLVHRSLTIHPIFKSKESTKDTFSYGAHYTEEHTQEHASVAVCVYFTYHLPFTAKQIFD